jgi:hypothetical protein
MLLDILGFCIDLCFEIVLEAGIDRLQRAGSR